MQHTHRRMYTCICTIAAASSEAAGSVVACNACAMAAALLSALPSPLSSAVGVSPGSCHVCVRACERASACKRVCACMHVGACTHLRVEVYDLSGDMLRQILSLAEVFGRYLSDNDV